MNDFLGILFFSPLLLLAFGLGVAIGEAILESRLTRKAQSARGKVKKMKTPNSIVPSAATGLYMSQSRMSDPNL